MNGKGDDCRAIVRNHGINFECSRRAIAASMSGKFLNKDALIVSQDRGELWNFILLRDGFEDVENRVLKPIARSHGASDDGSEQDDGKCGVLHVTKFGKEGWFEKRGQKKSA